MSLNTLLEAAHFIEYATPEAREKQATEFHHYAKPAPGKAKPAGSEPKSPKSDGDNKGKKRTYSSSSGTREVHNKLEKNRRAHLKECFDNLWNQIPHSDMQKTSNLNILRSALRYIQYIKRQDKEQERELQRLAQAKIASQQRIQQLHKELSAMQIQVDLSKFMKTEEDTHSMSTVTAEESPIMSEDEGEEGAEEVHVSKLSQTFIAEKLEENHMQPSTQKPMIKTLAAKKQVPPKIAEQVAAFNASANLPTTNPETAPAVSPQNWVSRPWDPPSKQHVSKILQQAIAERQKQQQQQRPSEQAAVEQTPLPGLVAQPQVLTVDSSALQSVVGTLKTSAPSVVTSLRPSLTDLLPSIVPSILTQPASSTATNLASSVKLDTSGEAVILTTTPTLAAKPTLAHVSIAGSNGQVVTMPGIKHLITPISAIPTAQVLPTSQFSALQHLMTRPTTSVTPIVTTQQPSPQLVPPLAVLPSVQLPLASTIAPTQVLRIPINSLPIIPQYTLPIKPLVMVTVPKVLSGTATVTTTSNS